MPQQLDLADLQGNILRAYGRQGFPKARYLFLHIKQEAAGRRLVDILRPRITTAVRWQSKANYPGEVIVDRPKVAINIGFTFYGLLALGLPTRTLSGLPPEFIDGMGARSDLLGDRGPNGDWQWDPIWQNNGGDRCVHAIVTFNCQMNPDGTAVADLDQETIWLQEQCRLLDDQVVILDGHNRDGKGLHQDASAVLAPNPDGVLQPTAKEHFGFTDGFGDPVFEGQYSGELEDIRAIGSGALRPDQTWRPLATGEFLMGYPDEAQEVPLASMPFEFSRNGTFMTYRKLHQNVGTFFSYIRNSAKSYAAVMQVPEDEARETLMAKIAGRWSDGVPLMVAPTYADWQAFHTQSKVQQQIEQVGHRRRQENGIAREFLDFKYAGDPQGLKCPMSAHLRRVNPRDMLDPTYQADHPDTWTGSSLNNRRRILRRGLPYGASNPEQTSDDAEHGIIFMAVCSSLFRQFEFIQQQWVQYGLDFNVGNDTDPLIGNHTANEKFIIPSSADSGKPPYICSRIPQFVETRGGEYFFLPSMTALRMIAMGIVDPT